MSENVKKDKYPKDKESLHKLNQSEIIKNRLGQDIASSLSMYFQDRWVEQTQAAIRAKAKEDPNYKSSKMKQDLAFAQSNYRCFTKLEEIMNTDDAREKFNSDPEVFKAKVKEKGGIPLSVTPDVFATAMFSILKHHTDFVETVQNRSSIEGVFDNVNDKNILDDAKQLINALNGVGQDGKAIKGLEGRTFNAQTIVDVFKPYGFDISMLEGNAHTYKINESIPGLNFETLMDEEKKKNPEGYQEKINKMKRLNELEKDQNNTEHEPVQMNSGTHSENEAANETVKESANKAEEKLKKTAVQNGDQPKAQQVNMTDNFHTLANMIRAPIKSLMDKVNRDDRMDAIEDIYSHTAMELSEEGGCNVKTPDFIRKLEILSSEQTLDNTLNVLNSGKNKRKIPKMVSHFQSLDTAITDRLEKDKDMGADEQKKLEDMQKIIRAMIDKLMSLFRGARPSSGPSGP